MLDSALDWFLLESEAFTQWEVCQITGISTVTLQNWANRGLLDVDSVGKGARRTYSAKYVAAIDFAKTMTAMGVEASFALSVGLSVQIGLMRKFRDLTKKQMPAGDIETSLLTSIVVIMPDKEAFKHKIDFIDAQKIGLHAFDLARGAIFLPIGPLLARVITSALKIKSINPEQEVQSA